MSKKQRKALTSEQKASKSATDKARRWAKATGTYLPKTVSAKKAAPAVEAVVGPAAQPTAPVAATEPAQAPAVEPQAQATADTVVVTQRGLAEEFTQQVLDACVAKADEAGIARLRVKDLRKTLGLDAKAWRQIALALEILEKVGKLSRSPGAIKVSRVHAEAA